MIRIKLFLFYLFFLGLIIHAQSAEKYWEDGLKYFQNGEYEKSIECFEHVNQLAPGYSETYFNIAKAYFLNGNYDKAINNLKSAIDIDEESQYYGALGLIYDTNGDYELAIKAYEKSIDLGMENYDVYYNCGNSYLYNFDYDNAINYYQKSLDLNQSFAMGLNQLGRIYYLKGDTTKAIEFWESAIKTDSTIFQSFFNLGKYQFEIGNYNKAIKIFNRVLGSDSSHIGANIFLSDVYDIKNENKVSLLHWQKARNIFNNNKTNHFLKMTLFHDLNFTAQSDFLRQKFRQAGILFLFLGDIYFDDGNIEKAMIYNEKAIEAFEKTSDTTIFLSIPYRNLGEFNIKKNKYTDALKYLSKAIEKNPEDGLAYYYLGLCYGKVGERLQEIDNYKKAAVLGNGEARQWLNNNHIN